MAGGLELCTLELNHYGLVENGVYKGGKVCYVDNCVDDYLSLVDLQKIGVELGYNVDITQRVTSLKVYYKKPGKFGASALIEVKDDSFIPGLIACIPGNRIVQLYYHDPTDLNTIGSQAFEVWPSLDSENYNGGTDEFKGHQYWPFIDRLANADNSVKKVNTYEAASVGIHEPINVEEVNGVDAPNKVFDVNHPNEVLDFHPPNEATGEISSDGEDIDIPYSGSDEEEGEQNFNKLSKKRKRKLPSFKQWRRDTDLRNPEFRLGMQFANKAEVKEAIKEWAIINGREVKFVKDDKIRVRAKCVGNKKTKCPFTIFASIIDSYEPTFAIKTLCLDHHCGRVGKLKFANSKWLAEKFADKIKKNPHWNVGAFKSEVLDQYRMNVSRHQIYRAKRLSKLIIERSYKEQYARLWDYAEQLKVANKGSTVVISNKMEGDQPVFRRMYVCLEACKKGFLEGCRHVIGVDGCHLKGPYTGQILTAVGVDGNNGMFPIAYAIVEIENKSSWIWFLELLKADLNIENGAAWVFISDKQKGLIPAIQSVLPTTEHRMCWRHLYNNFKASHPGLALKNTLWALATSNTIPWFDVEMEKMKQQDEKAWIWIQKRPPQNWSRAYFASHFKCDILLNNLCESFNSRILDARDKAILTCLERIMVYIMLRMANRRIAARHWKHPVGPRIFKIIEKNKLGASQCIPMMAGDKKFLVQHMYGAEFVVDLKAKTCSCRRWDLCGIPCPHAISCIFSTDENVYDYTHDCYKQEAYLISYDPIVHPVPSMDQWKKTGLPAIRPPPYKKQPGRPKMSRTKEVGEVQAPAPPPPNPIPPDYIPPPAKLKRIFVKGYSDHFHQINGPNPSTGIGKPKGCGVTKGKGKQATQKPVSTEKDKEISSSIAKGNGARTS
nr:uncharacterized protein LOC114824095 [Malus domestica]